MTTERCTHDVPLKRCIICNPGGDTKADNVAYTGKVIPMTNPDPLDQLYEAATRFLAEYMEGPPMQTMLEERLEVSKWVIDRWFARREADRQYELQENKMQMGTDLGTQIAELINGLVEGNQPDAQDSPKHERFSG